MYAIIALALTFLCYTGNFLKIVSLFSIKISLLFMEKKYLKFFFSIPHVWFEAKRSRKEKRRIRRQ